MSNDEYKSEFRCEKREILNLKDVLNFPEEIITYNKLNVDSAARCIPLQIFGYGSKV